VCGLGSSAQSFKNGANECGINGAFNADQCTTRNLDVHRQARSQSLDLLLLYCQRFIVGDRDRKQLYTSRRLWEPLFTTGRRSTAFARKTAGSRLHRVVGQAMRATGSMIARFLQSGASRGQSSAAEAEMSLPLLRFQSPTKHPNRSMTTTNRA
jgi:hypothetical protein